MLTSLSVILGATLLTFLPSPATPTVTRPLSSSEMGDILSDIQNVVDALQESSSADDTSPTGGVMNAPLLGLSPEVLDSEHYQPGPLERHSEPSSDRRLPFPASSYEGGEGGLLNTVHALPKSDRGAPFSALRDTPAKRVKPSLCHLLRLSMGNGCAYDGRRWNVPDRRSGTSMARAQRKNSPSLYLFGGAFGR